MTETYSQFGCPGNNFLSFDNFNLKIIIDPPKSYFKNQLLSDRKKFDKLLLIQGMEPVELNNISNEIIQNKIYFDKILTSFEEVLNFCENSELFLYASCWILTDKEKKPISLKKDYENIFSTNKKFKLSHVMSNKNFLPGHKLRHETKDIIRKKRKFDLLFPESIEGSLKYKLFEDSMFHISIENTKNNNYISEKIVDCFMSYTIPIYWGTPSVFNFFNKDGIIFFETENELESILDNLSEKDYTNRIKYVIENYRTAKEKYGFWYDRVNEKILELKEN
jgi:hypothetical protein